MTRYAIGLGSNLGDRVANLQFAVSGFDSVGDVLARSRIYETDPVGGPEQDRFLNAVILIDTDLEPLPLIAFCHGLEADAGRVREVHWGPRTLDVDILAWEGGVFSTGGLVIPHPRAHQRAFVLIPLVEVWPDAVLANGETASDSLDDMDDQGVTPVDVGSWSGYRVPGTGYTKERSD